MYWLSLLALTLALYTPPLFLARQLWRWTVAGYWDFPLLGRPCPPELAYAIWLAIAYLALGTALHLIGLRLPPDGGLRRLAGQVSQAGLGAPGVLAPALALALVLLAWPLLPLARALWGWRYAISPPVAALAAVYLLAEALRLAENNFWADRAFAAGRAAWLAEHGYHRLEEEHEPASGAAAR